MIVHVSRAALTLALTGVLASPAQGQATPDRPERDAGPAAAESEARGARVAKALGGGAAGLAIHEAGHLLAGTLVGADFDLRKVDFHGIPFIAVSHAPGLAPREEYAVSSAGLWMQYASSEWILTAHPTLRSEPRPFEKGVLAFHVGLSVMYGVAGLARIGPPERDTRGMAASLGVSERWIGLAVAVPGVLAAYRYAHPDARWAGWASRGLKVALVGMTVLGGGR